MKLHNLKNTPGSVHKSKRVGRGGKRGTTACRGTKGQKARSGYSMRPGFEGGRTPLVSQLPKFKGNKSLKGKAETITFKMLEESFQEGDTVSFQSLKKKGLLSSRNKEFKIVCTGEPKKRLIFHNCNMSKKAHEKITASGSEIKK